jgi:hypothetical protein
MQLLDEGHGGCVGKCRSEGERKHSPASALIAVTDDI